MPATHLGGRYSARQNSDGTLDIFDVPIVSELAKGERKDLPDFEITPEWLAAALARADKRAKIGYLPPLHVHHHDDKTPSPRAGYFSPKRIGEMDLDGRPVKTLYADLLRIPKAVADRVKAGELPYRSIEILNVNAEPEIDSLALLDSQPPQFRYPLGTIGQMVHAQSAELHPLTASQTPACAFAAFPGTDAAKASFHFGGASMADKNNDGKKDAEKDEEKLQAADKNNDGERDKEKLAAAGDLDAPGGDVPAADAAPPWVAGMVQSIIDGVSAAIGGAQAAKPPAAPLPTEDDQNTKILSADGEAGKPKFIDPTMEGSLIAKAVKAAGAQFSGKLAEQSGEISGLKAALKARDKKDADRAAAETTKDLIRSAKMELRSCNLDEETLETDLPAAAKFGKAYLDQWVAGIKRVAPKDPAETLDGFTGEARESDAPEVARFAAKGAEHLNLARQCQSNFEQLKARGALPRHMTLERYLACNAPMFEAAASRN